MKISKKKKIRYYPHIQKTLSSEVFVSQKGNMVFI